MPAPAVPVLMIGASPLLRLSIIDYVIVALYFQPTPCHRLPVRVQPD